jgi:hypothetical protein
MKSRVTWAESFCADRHYSANSQSLCFYQNVPKNGNFVCYGIVPGQLSVARIQTGGLSLAVMEVFNLITRMPGLSQHSPVQLLLQILFLNLSLESRGR